jgi:hypothetical protein
MGLVTDGAIKSWCERERHWWDRGQAIEDPRREQHPRLPHLLEVANWAGGDVWWLPNVLMLFSFFLKYVLVLTVLYLFYRDIH